MGIGCEGRRGSSGLGLTQPGARLSAGPVPAQTPGLTLEKSLEISAAQHVLKLGDGTWLDLHTHTRARMHTRNAAAAAAAARERASVDTGSL